MNKLSEFLNKSWSEKEIKNFFNITGSSSEDSFDNDFELFVELIHFLSHVRMDVKSWARECIKELKEEQEIAYEEYDDGLTDRTNSWYEIQRIISFLENNVLEVEE